MGSAEMWPNRRKRVTASFLVVVMCCEHSSLGQESLSRIPKSQEQEGILCTHLPGIQKPLHPPYEDLGLLQVAGAWQLPAGGQDGQEHLWAGGVTGGKLGNWV